MPKQQQPVNNLPQIHIQQVNIRARGLPEHTVQSALSSLAPALQAEAARHPQMSHNARLHQAHTINIPHLQLSSIRARGDSQQLRQVIARGVVNGIADSISHVNTSSAKVTSSNNNF